MCSVGVGIAEEESEGNDGPRIAVTVVRPPAWKSTTCTNVILTRTSESLRRISLPTIPVVCRWAGIFGAGILKCSGTVSGVVEVGTDVTEEHRDTPVINPIPFSVTLLPHSRPGIGFSGDKM